MTKDTGIVNIHGKNYKTVAKRVDEFRQEHKQELAIITSIISRDENTVVMKAEIIDKDGWVIATGYAEENRQESQINRTSALENCETSAIGRALANFGLAGGEYASADEVANAINQQGASKSKTGGFKIDFNSIRETCDAIDDEESLKKYYEELKSQNPTPNQLGAINKIISKRKAQLAER